MNAAAVLRPPPATSGITAVGSKCADLIYSNGHIRPGCGQWAYSHKEDNVLLPAEQKPGAFAVGVSTFCIDVLDDAVPSQQKMFQTDSIDVLFH